MTFLLQHLHNCGHFYGVRVEYEPQGHPRFSVTTTRYLATAKNMHPPPLRAPISTHHGTHDGYVRLPSRHPRPAVARGLGALPLLAVNSPRNGSTSSGSMRGSGASVARVVVVQALRDVVHGLNSGANVQHFDITHSSGQLRFPFDYRGNAGQIHDMVYMVYMVYISARACSCSCGGICMTPLFAQHIITANAGSRLSTVDRDLSDS